MESNGIVRDRILLTPLWNLKARHWRHRSKIRCSKDQGEKEVLWQCSKVGSSGSIALSKLQSIKRRIICHFFFPDLSIISDNCDSV